MADGERFTNAGYIDVGLGVAAISRIFSCADGDKPDAGVAAGEHVVERSASRCGRSPTTRWGRRVVWPELYEVNQGNAMGDGSVLVEPDLIMPGWRLGPPDLDARPPSPLR